MQAQKAPGGGEEEKREKQKATLFPNPEEIVLITLLASLWHACDTARLI